MSGKDTSFPWRVAGFAALLFAAFAAIGWLLFASGGSSVDPDEAATAGTDAAEASPSGAGPDATPTETDPARELPGGEPRPLDPSTPEGRAALAQARADSGTMDLQLFLILPGVEKLIPVLRTVAAPSTLDTQVKRAVQELIDWVSTDTISPVAPEAGIREVWVSPGGIAYVDFDRAFYDFSGGGSLGELHTVYGVVHTLTESFPEILAVQFLIEGRGVDTLAGHVDLSVPLLPSDEWALLEQREPQIDPVDGSG